MDALVSTVREFWPASRPAAHVRGRGGAAAGSTSFVVIPSAASPRLLVPLTNPTAAARSMQRFSAALTVPEAARRMALGAALRVGGARMFGDRVEVASTDDTDSLACYLGTVLGEKVSFSLGIGNARVNRKPVLQVFGEDGRDLAFVKIGNTPVSRADVGGEAEALQALGTRRFSSLEVPRVLHTGTWNGMFVLVMSSLPTTIQKAPKHRRAVPTTAMAELAAAFGDGDRPLTDSPLWHRLQRSAAGLRDDEARERLLSALEIVAERAGGRSWPIGAWHGDWTPWNMARRGELLQLWDWERFETGVPSGLDHFHFTVNELSRRRGFQIPTIRAGLEAAVAGREGSRADARLLGAVYLLALTSRYLTLGQGEGGEAISTQGATALRALHDWLGVRG
jgi:hypothetical protein